MMMCFELSSSCVRKVSLLLVFGIIFEVLSRIAFCEADLAIVSLDSLVCKLKTIGVRILKNVELLVPFVSSADIASCS